MDIKQIGDLRELRRRAMPGPAKGCSHPGYFGVEGVQVGPSIRCLGSKRAENQAFIVVALVELVTASDDIESARWRRARDRVLSTVAAVFAEKE